MTPSEVRVTPSEVRLFPAAPVADVTPSEVPVPCAEALPTAARKYPGLLADKDLDALAACSQACGHHAHVLMELQFFRTWDEAMFGPADRMWSAENTESADVLYDMMNPTETRRPRQRSG